MFLNWSLYVVINEKLVVECILWANIFEMTASLHSFLSIFMYH